MKVLLLNCGDGEAIENTDVIVSTLQKSSPFGYDLIIARPNDITLLAGRSSNLKELVARWRFELTEWLKTGNTLVILAQPHSKYSDVHNYSWLPKGIEYERFIDSGENKYIGQVTSKSPEIKNLLTQDIFCLRSSYYTGDKGFNEEIHAKTSDRSITAFSTQKGQGMAYFIPSLHKMSDIDKLIKIFMNVESELRIEESIKIQEQIKAVDGEIEQLTQQRENLLAELSSVNEKVREMADTDIYLRRALGSLSQVKASSNPEPDLYYEGVESIENAFGSRRNMREKLGFTKTYIDALMARTNEFRHVAKNGQAPTPLSDEEKEKFNTILSSVITKYTEYLLEAKST